MFFIPRAWKGTGAYANYIYCMRVFQACLRDPDDPLSAFNTLGLQDMENMKLMTEFFLEKGVLINDIKSIKNSCLHRLHKYVSAAWTALEGITEALNQTVSPLELAMLSTQARDVVQVPIVLMAFQTALVSRGVIVGSSHLMYRLLVGLVRLSNAIVDVEQGDAGEVNF